MSRTNSVRYDLRKNLLPGIKNHTTKRAYIRAIDGFSAWAKGEKIRHLKDLSIDDLQAYEIFLEKSPKGYSPATIHDYLAPICKGAGVPMDRIRKPRRTAEAIRRGRRQESNPQGKKELVNPAYKDCINLQKCVGIRRAEIERLTVNDWDGKYITVKRGKGGKRQRQYVLPEDRPTVSRIFEARRDAFDDVADAFDDQPRRLFDPKEIPQKANLHSIRAQHAQRAYTYFQSRMGASEAVRSRMRAFLVKRFEESNQRLLKDNPKAYRVRLQKFIKDMDDRPYLLRGENLKKAVSLGLPTTYDRLALMMVSVLELSHWRLDVTVINYMIQ